MSNCGITSAVDAVVASTGTKVLELVNALELNWALPYAVPNDRTFAKITCKTEQQSGADTDAKRYSHDPLRIHQSSIIAKGWGTGHCFYLGVDKAAAGDHIFECRDMGKLAASSNLQLAFQYHLTNAGKTYKQGGKDAADTQIVVQIAKTLSCKLEINTYTGATSSAVNWYTSTFTTNVDGNAQTSKSGQW